MPKLFNRISNFFNRKSFWISGFRSVFFSENEYQPTKRDYLDSYDNCHLVFTCAKKIGEAVANTERKLYQIKGSYGKEIIDEVPDHELLDLLDKPNKFMTGFELFKGISIDLDLLGNSYILKARGENKKTLELWPLRPDWVEIVPDEKELIKGYKYRVSGGGEQTYEFDDVIHIKELNPKSSFYGLPTIKPAMEIVRSLVYAIRWNMNFFYNSARPDFVIFTKNRIQDKDRVEFEKKWREKFGGVEGSHKFGMIYGEESRIERLTQTMKDMDFNVLTTETTNQILAAFGVPKSIIGMMGMNRAEAEAQMYAFLSQTVEPRYKMINEKLNEFLVPEFGDNLYLDYVDPTPENRDVLIKEYETALRMNWMVINEVRDLEGLPPLDGGWDFYLPIMMMPAGGVPEKEQNKIFKIKGIKPEAYYKSKKEKADLKLKKRVMAGKKKLKTELKLKEDLVKVFAGYLKTKNKLKFTPEKKRELWEEHDKLLTGDEKTFKIMVSGLFKSQQKRVIAALKERFGKAEGDLINWKNEKTLFAKVALPFFTDIVKRRGKRAADLIGDTFEMTTEVRKFIDDKTMTFAGNVNDTTKEALKETLAEGVGEGEGIPELTKRVNELFDNREKWESERIARTEVISASNGAELEAYRQSDVVDKKEWSASPGACEICEALNGEVVGLDEAFSSGDDAPAAHPNCRCAVLPVIE